MVNWRIFWICIVLLLTQVSACSGIPKRHWSAIEGQVLDQDTGQPIEGALVIALWRGVGAYTTSMCFHVDTVITNADGNYHIPDWRNLDGTAYINQQRVELVSYKENYNYWGSPEQHVQYLKKFEGTSTERLKILRGYLIWTACGNTDEDMRNRLTISRAFYDEASKVAKTREDQEILMDILFSVERYELGNQEAYKRAIQRYKPEKKGK